MTRILFTLIFIFSGSVFSSPEAASDSSDTKRKRRSLVDLTPGSPGFHTMAECIDQLGVLGRFVDPTPLTQDKTIVPFQEEYPLRGHLVTSREQLQNLPDGIYVYTLTQRDAVTGEDLLVITARREADRDHPEFFLTTHRSHVGFLHLILQNDPLIAGAGEFEIRNGKVAANANQSRTFLKNDKGEFQNELTHLLYAASRLMGKGLNVTEKTVLLDLSVDPANHVGPAHGDARDNARREEEVAKSEELMKVLYLVSEADKMLFELFPHPVVPGYFDSTPLQQYIIHTLDIGLPRDIEHQLIAIRGQISEINEALNMARKKNVMPEGWDYQTEVDRIPGLKHEYVQLKLANMKPCPYRDAFVASLKRMQEIRREIEAFQVDENDLDASMKRLEHLEVEYQQNEGVLWEMPSLEAQVLVMFLELLQREGPAPIVHSYRNDIPMLQFKIIQVLKYADELAEKLRAGNSDVWPTQHLRLKDIEEMVRKVRAGEASGLLIKLVDGFDQTPPSDAASTPTNNSALSTTTDAPRVPE